MSHPRDIRTLNQVIRWIKGFRGDNVRNVGGSVYVGSGPQRPYPTVYAWRPRQLIVHEEYNDYLICYPYRALSDESGTTEIKVAKPLDMRGGDERWGVYPAYVPAVSQIWVAEFLDNNCVDDEGKPVLLMDMNVDGRSAAGFWATVGTATADTTNKWTYEVTEQTQTASGFEDLANGRVVSAVLNGAEANNDGTGIQGNGVDIDGAIFTANPDLELQKIQGSPVVWVTRTYDTFGAAVYAFSMPNAIDGECA